MKTSPGFARRFFPACLLLACAATASAQVLNKNPTFNTDYLPWSWFYGCNGAGPPCGSVTPTIGWSSLGNPGGSAQISWPVSSYPGFTFGLGSYGARVSVVPGATYTFSADVLVQNAASLGAGGYRVDVYTSNPAAGYDSDSGWATFSPVSTGVWNSASGTFVAPAGAETAEFEVSVPEVAGASYNFDNVSLSGPRGPGRAASFNATPTSITAGQSATLTWTAVDATSATLNGVPVAGCCADTTYGNQWVSVTVQPATTTTYTLVSTGPGGTSTWSGPAVTVNVTPASCPTMSSANIAVAYSGGTSGCTSSGAPCSVGETISFTVASFGYSFSCATHTFTWNFGDGSAIGSGQNVAHTYATAGTYSPSVTISNGTQTFTTSASLAVNAACPAMSSANIGIGYSGSSSGCHSGSNCIPGEPVSFTAQSFGYNFACAPHTFGWNFGDGGTATGQTVTHAFSSPGSYPVSLSISNSTQTYTSSAVVQVASPPPTASLLLSPSTISLGQTALLSWATNATLVTIDNGIGTVPSNGSMRVSPAATTTYTLTASGPGGVATASATLTVTRPCVLTCSTTVPANGTSASVVQFRASVQTTDCPTQPGDVWTFGDGTTSTQAVASHVYAAPGNYTWTFTATTADQTCFQTGQIVINPAIPLRIVSFVATPPTIRGGDSVTLSWVTEGAQSVIMNNGIGAQPAAGSVTLQPKATTTYTLTATQGSSTATESVTVQVLTAPVIDVALLPAPMVQLQGVGGATTTYALTNSGGSKSSIVIAQDGDFFDQSPKSFDLHSGATQIITITGKASPAGVLDGTALVSGAGVPPNLRVAVRLLSSAPPSGPVNVDADRSRVDVAGPAASNPTGSIDFTNHGTVALTGVLSSDVPWVIPQGGVITIPAGATVPLTFQIDRSKRPDADALIGSAEGNLRLSFLTGGSGFAKRTLDSSSSNISVQLVRVIDTVQTSVAPGNVPALAAGEVAIFVPGVGHFTRMGQGSARLEFLSDVSLSNAQGNRALEDVKLFYTPTAGNSAAAQTTTIPPTPANVSVAIADAAKNIFGVNEQIGTLHVRSKDAARMSVAATSVASGNPAGAVGTDLPIMRSDRAAKAGEIVALTGLRKDAAAHTDLYLQETSGLSASVQIDFTDANGLSVGSPQTVTLDPFRLREMADAVPSGAVSAILTNASSNGATFLAYGSLVDEQSKDTWIVADWSRQFGYATSEAVVIPVAGNMHGANGTFYRSDVAIMNRTNAAGSGTLRYTSRNGTVVDRQITLAPRATTVLPDAIATQFGMPNDLGFLTFTPTTGTFAITSRAYTSAPGQSGAFSSSIPAVARASALPNGGSVIIASLEDADRRTLSAARPGTFRTNVALVETSGKPVTVRVTLRYTFPAGLSAQGMGASEPRDFVIGGNGMLFLNSVADEMLAKRRLCDLTGDLKRIEASFQVVGGDGQVLVTTSSIDNRSGDSVVRSQ